MVGGLVRLNMPFWPGVDPSEILDSFKERYREGKGPPPTISRLEAACLRFQPSLFGYRRSDVDRFQREAVEALALLESSAEEIKTPDPSLRPTLIGVSPRELAEFKRRVIATLTTSHERGLGS